MNYKTAYLIKKLSLLSIAAAVFLSPSAALAATLSLSPSTATVNKNCTFSVDVILDTQSQDTDGTDVILTYDTTKFNVTTASIVNGKIYADYPGNSITSGKISISGIAPASQPYNGKGTFATLNVQVLSSAAGAGTFKFDFDPNDKIKTTDTNVVQGGADPVDILTQVLDGSYTIGTGTTCTVTGAGAGTGTAGTGLGAAAGAKTLPAGTRQGATGNQLLNGSPATDSALIYKQLPESGLGDTTWIIATVGIGLTILGIIGLSIL